MADAERTLVVNVATLDEVKKRTVAAMGAAAPQRVLSFASLDLLWQALSPKRIDLLRVMAGAGPMSIREAARRASRDVKAVHGDVVALIERGVIRRTQDGRVELPYDEIRLDVTLTGTAAA